MSVEPKQALVLAIKYLNDFYPDNQFTDLKLEEVNLSENKNAWEITLGFQDLSKGPALSVLQREYKRFKINRATGEFEGMEIRTAFK